MIWWIVGVLVGSTFVVETAFVYCYSAKRLLDQGLLPRDFKLIAYFWFAIGVVADFVFNHTRGCLAFREGPRGLLFTQRVQHHVDHSDGWRYDKAMRWARILNAIDPAHIRL